METITFTSTFTFPKQSVLGFALFLGYRTNVEKLENGEVVWENGNIVMISNPQSPAEFISDLAKKHINQFTTQWANYLVEEHIKNNVKPQVEEQVLKPVLDALTVSYEENN